MSLWALTTGVDGVEITLQISGQRDTPNTTPNPTQKWMKIDGEPCAQKPARERARKLASKFARKFDPTGIPKLDRMGGASNAAVFRRVFRSLRGSRSSL
jgi:hypothetical protein